MSLKRTGGNEEQKRVNELNKIFNPKVKGSLKVVSEMFKKLPEHISQEEVLAQAEQAGFDLSLLSKQANGSYTQEYTLYSGEVVPFVEMYIPYEDLDNLIVEDGINGRSQERLTEESLSDILATLDKNQFIPVFGSIREDGKINLGDGSRRKAAAKITRTGLKALISTKPIKDADLRILAMQIQTAREHDIYEKGVKWLALELDGIEGKEIANLHGVSEATISRGKKAARVPVALLDPIANRGDIPSLGWDFLTTLKELITAHYPAKDNSFDYAFNEFVTSALGREVPKHSLKAAEVLKSYEARAKILDAEAVKNKGESKPKPKSTGKVRLKEGDGKVFFDRKVTSKGDTSFFVGKMPENLREEIEAYINQKIDDYLKASK